MKTIRKIMLIAIISTIAVNAVAQKNSKKSKVQPLTNCWNEGGVKRILREPEENAGLPHPAVPYEEQLEQVVIGLSHGDAQQAVGREAQKPNWKSSPWNNDNIIPVSTEKMKAAKLFHFFLIKVNWLISLKDKFDMILVGKRETWIPICCHK